MEILFEFNRDDIWNYGKHVTFNTTKFKFRMGVNVVMVPIFVILIGTIRKFSIPEYIFYVGGFTALYVYVLNSVLKSKMVKINTGKGGPLGAHTVKIDEMGIYEKLPDREVFHAWNEISKIEDDKKYFYIKWSDTSAHVIPKRALKDIEEGIVFLDTAMSYWNCSKK